MVAIMLQCLILLCSLVSPSRGEVTDQAQRDAMNALVELLVFDSWDPTVCDVVYMCVTVRVPLAALPLYPVL